MLLLRNKGQQQNNSLPSFATCFCRQSSGFSELQAHNCILPKQWTWLLCSVSAICFNIRSLRESTQLIRIKLLISRFPEIFALNSQFPGGTNARFAPSYGRPCCWPLSVGLSKSQVYLCASWWHLILKCSIARLEKQNRKFVPILIITEAKKCSIIFVRTNKVCSSEAWGFCKNDSDPSRFILWKTWLETSRVTIFLNVTRVQSESLTRVTLSLLGNLRSLTRSHSWCFKIFRSQSRSRSL